MGTKLFSLLALLTASIPQNYATSVIAKYNKYFGTYSATTTSEQSHKDHIALLTTAMQTCLNNNNNNKVTTTRQVRDIPGTDLKSRTFYKLGLKSFRGGGVTWTTATNSTYHYITVDNGYSQSPPRNAGGGGEVWSQDYDWEFIPVLHKGTEETGWYGLKNRGRGGKYLGWSDKDSSNGGQSSFLMVLDTFQEGRSRKESFHLKPVEARVEGGTYYQLKLKELPGGAVTWTEMQYGTNAHFIQVDNAGGDRVSKYKKGGDWYKDTLFTFEESDVVEKAEEEELGYQ